MPKNVIKIELSQKSISEAIRKINKYKNNFSNKNDVFVKRLAELGIPIIDENIYGANGDSDRSHNTYIKLNSFGNYSQAKLIVEGKDILFIEFGSGIHFNGASGSSPHPLGEELGYTIGSYGKGRGKNDSWTYTAETGEWVRSYGTEATMPVYKARTEIIQNIRRIAKEVFSSGGG